MAKDTGNPWMWCLIPIGLFATVTGLIVGLRLSEQSSHSSGRSGSSRNSR